MTSLGEKILFEDIYDEVEKYLTTNVKEALEKKSFITFCKRSEKTGHRVLPVGVTASTKRDAIRGLAKAIRHVYDRTTVIGNMLRAQVYQNYNMDWIALSYPVVRFNTKKNVLAYYQYKQLKDNYSVPEGEIPRRV